MTRVSLSLSLSARSSPSVARYKGIKVSRDERRWGEEGERERIKDDDPDKFCFSNGCVVLGCTLTTIVMPEVNTPWYRFC